MNAVIYARVSTREQEQEGYSIPAQLKLLRDYAFKNGLTIQREFCDSESAKSAGRKSFGEMLTFLKRSKIASEECSKTSTSRMMSWPISCSRSDIANNISEANEPKSAPSFTANLPSCAGRWIVPIPTSSMGKFLKTSGLE